VIHHSHCEYFSQDSTFISDQVENKHFFDEPWRGETAQNQRAEELTDRNLSGDRLRKHQKVLHVLLPSLNQEIKGE
jgi:hypothetical protein